MEKIFAKTSATTRTEDATDDILINARMIGNKTSPRQLLKKEYLSELKLKVFHGNQNIPFGISLRLVPRP